MQEKIGTYPFSPGTSGIDFNQISNHDIRNVQTGYIVAGSGNNLYYKTASNFVYVYDMYEGQPVRMKASTSLDGKVAFDIRTKDFKTVSKHPDMYAAQFIGFAFEYFINSGITPKGGRTTWQQGTSDNYQMFVDEYDKSKDKIKAAKSTWTGKVLKNFGFLPEKDSVEITETEENGKIVRVVFSGDYKPVTSKI